MNLKDVQSQLKERVAKGLNFGIEGLEGIIDKNSNIFNDFILLKSKYNDLMYVSSQNTLDYEQIEVGLDRLRSNTLNIIDKLGEQDIKKEDVKKDLKVQALPTRRANFFKLLDIHFQNLQGIFIVELFGDQERRKTGREAVYHIYYMHKRQFRNREDLAGSEGLQILRAYFKDFYSNEKGMLEVYFKNIKHLLDYTFESEIDRPFFLNIIRSLFSKYEIALIFYYAISQIDPDFEELFKKGGLMTSLTQEILIVKDHVLC